MDVSLFVRRLLCFAVGLLSLTLISCGNRYDLSTAAGQQSRIDDANSYLSIGDCSDANNSIAPLYNSQYVTDQVKIIYASVQACYAHFNLLTMAADLASASSIFNGLALSLSSTVNDGSIQWMYDATDVMTQNGTLMGAVQRSTSDNDYMVFLQLGVMSAIMRNYGNPSGSGGEQTALTFPGNVSTTDACALAAALSFISDSYSQSDLTDGTTKSTVSSLNSICTAAGLSSCTALNRDRTQCAVVSSTNYNNAAAVVSGVSSAW